MREFLTRADRTAIRTGDDARAARPAREAWESLATTVRLLLDYLRFFEPAFHGAVSLRARVEKRLPRVYATLVRACRPEPRVARALLAALLRGARARDSDRRRACEASCASSSRTCCS